MIKILFTSPQHQKVFHDIIVPILTIVIPTAASLIGVWMGNKISEKSRKNEIKQERYLKYLEATNDFIADINTIIMDMVNLRKLACLLVTYAPNANLTTSYIYNDLNDCHNVLNNIKNFSLQVKQLNTSSINYPPMCKKYKDDYLEMANKLLNFNLFIEICKKYQKGSLNYFYQISKELRKENAILIMLMTEATKNNLVEFNIEQYRNRLVEHIEHINKEIGFDDPAQEPNYFNFSVEELLKMNP